MTTIKRVFIITAIHAQGTSRAYCILIHTCTGSLETNYHILAGKTNGMQQYKEQPLKESTFVQLVATETLLTAVGTSTIALIQ